MDNRPLQPTNPNTWKSAAVEDLDRVAARDFWGRAIIGIGWIHLIAFAICEQMFTRGILRGTYYLAVWSVELIAVLVLMRAVAGPGWARSTPLAGVIVKIWATFLILSFNLASLNTLSGFEHDWFKPPLATLSTFGFATLAYLIDRRFFIFAVQMYFTGLLMVMNPRHSYAIYGASWWLALQAIGVALERRRIALNGRVTARAVEGRESSLVAAL
jgi:hypothetical protein